MYISARDRQILELLVNENKEWTVRDLADRINVSPRTVYRDLNNVEEILRYYEIHLEKKSGVGIKIFGDGNQISELKRFLFSNTQKEYTPEERVLYILFKLLESQDAVKLMGIALDLNVTSATISNDLDRLEEFIRNFGLTLIRRRGYGIELTGSEESKRKALINVISQNIDENTLINLTRDNILNPASIKRINSISQRLFGLVQKNTLVLIENSVEAVLKEMPFSLAESAMIGLIVHISLAIERIQNGYLITMDESNLSEIQEIKEYQYAKEIASLLETHFNVRIPEAEIAYITMHLKGAKLRYEKELFLDPSDLDLALRTNKLIHEVSYHLHNDLSNQPSLYDGLITHLKTALYRLSQNMRIQNPLIDKIKVNYNQLFQTVKVAVEKVFPEYNVPDEEIGYIVLHFGAILLKENQKVALRAAVICSSGIGTSKILVSRIIQEFPNTFELRTYSVNEFKETNPNEYDYVISTIPIPDYTKDYSLVSPILDQHDIEQINRNINIIQNKIPMVPSQTQIGKDHLPYKNSNLFIQRLQMIENISQTISTLLKGFKLTKLLGIRDKSEVLYFLCHDLYENNNLSTVDEVVQDLLKREEINGLGIPNTTMALYHTKSTHVYIPSFTICALEKPIEVLAMDNSKIQMKNLLLMLAPENMPEDVQEVLSYISGLLVSSKENLDLFQSADEKRILEFLTLKFDQLFKEKIQDSVPN